MKTNHTQLLVTFPQAIGLAALSAESATENANYGVAALGAELTTDNESDGWYQLFADGHFAAVDGRPDDVPGGKWLMDESAFAMLKAYTPHQESDLVIDYEHQTQRTKQNGKPAPAAGWVHLSAMEYRPGEGVFIKPRWTDNAQAMLDAGEYRYLSPVFSYDKATGRPVALMSIALTNRPGQDGLNPVAELNANFDLTFFTPNSQHGQTEDPTVNELLKQLLAKLGIEVNAEQPTNEQATAALSALDEMKTKAESVDGLETSIAELKAQQGPPGVNLKTHVPIELYQARCTEVAELRAETNQLTVDQVIEKAQTEGRLYAGETDYCKQFAAQNGIAELSAMLDQRSPIAALNTPQTSTVDKPTDTSTAALTAEDKYAADQLGISHDEFAAQKKDAN